MSSVDRQTHWESVYTTKGEKEVSWFQERPEISLEFIAATGAGPNSAIVDIGGGASRLVDALLDDGYRKLTVLDLSKAALAASRERLGLCGETVTWVAADVTTWGPSEHYGVWHDRAAFHFLTDEKDRHAYVLRLEQALGEGGEAIIGTFALNGPERCSGLPMMRYDSSGLTAVLGPKFRLLASREAERRTPWGASQVFQFSRFSFSP